MSQSLRLTLRLGIAIVLTLCIRGMNDASDGGREFSRCTRACTAIYPPVDPWRVSGAG